MLTPVKVGSDHLKQISLKSFCACKLIEALLYGLLTQSKLNEKYIRQRWDSKHRASTLDKDYNLWNANFRPQPAIVLWIVSAVTPV